MFDVVIKGGLLVDGVSDTEYKADIAITGDLISAIENDIPARKARVVIDAEGQVVAPGFVDPHSHSDYYLIIDNRAESKLLQGVTTEIGGNCGYSAAPMDGALREMRAKDYKEQFGIDVTWRSLDEYFKKLAASKPAINFGALLGYNTIRGSVMGFEDRAPTADEMGRIKEMIGANLDQGGLGVSAGLVYPPACYAKEDELIEALGEVAKRGKVFTTHIRSEGPGLLDSLGEVTRIAKGSGVKLQVSHLKTAGKANWRKVVRAIEILERARADGVELMADRYPYLASNTGLQVVLPDRAFDGGRDNLIEKLKDKNERAAFKEEILQNHPEPEYWDEVMVAQVTKEKNKDLEGLTVAQGAKKRGKGIFDFIFDLLVEESANVEAIYFVMCQENMDLIMKKPWVTLGSDAGARNVDGPLAIGKPHPRTFGSFPAFFARYVNDTKTFTLPEAIKKTSTMACDFFGLTGRGRLATGNFADVVVFDPNKMADNSTYTDPLNYPTGVSHVFVNGLHAVKDGCPTGLNGGRAVTS